MSASDTGRNTARSAGRKYSHNKSKTDEIRNLNAFVAGIEDLLLFYI